MQPGGHHRKLLMGKITPKTRCKVGELWVLVDGPK